jgi:Ca-activated chloride channel homolog
MLRPLQLLLLLVSLFVVRPLHGQTGQRQAEALMQRSAAAVAPANKLLTVNAGERLFLQLETPLNTSGARVGDPVEFKTTEDTLVGGLVAIPRGSSVSGRVSKVRRPGRLKGRAELGIRVDQVTLADGTSFSLSVSVVRAGFTQLSSNKGEPSLKGEGGSGFSVISLAEGGLQGVTLGGPYGAAVGMAMGLVIEVFHRGPDLDLPRDMLFEVTLRRPLEVTAAVAQRAAQLARTTLRSSSTSVSPLPANDLSEDSTEAVPDFSQDEHSIETKSPEASETTEVAAAITTTPPVPQAPQGDTRRTAPVFEDTDHSGEFKLEVDVQLVMVDAVVRDRKGRLMDNLRREDFRVFEDGIEQPITSFSRDGLPLAVALVVDRSGSVAFVMRQLQRAAYQTLSQLKPDDQVALFTFADQTERLEDLTTDCQRIADRIATIEARGATNINDALFDAIHYLSSVAQDRRRAVILISDNKATTKPRSSERKLIRLATESETVVYSIKIADQFAPVVSIPGWLDRGGSVAKVVLETGGEIVDVPDKGSLRAAMAAIVSRLRLRYALGYRPTYAFNNDAFRKINVRLADRFGQVDSDYSVHARRGYYPSTQRVAAQNKPRP